MTLLVQIDDQIREATEEESLVIEKLRLKNLADEQAKLNAKQSAKAKLQTLGLDEDDLKALGL